MNQGGSDQAGLLALVDKLDHQEIAFFAIADAGANAVAAGMLPFVAEKQCIDLNAGGRGQAAGDFGLAENFAKKGHHVVKLALQFAVEFVFGIFDTRVQVQRIERIVRLEVETQQVMAFAEGMLGLEGFVETGTAKEALVGTHHDIFASAQLAFHRLAIVAEIQSGIKILPGTRHAATQCQSKQT